MLYHFFFWFSKICPNFTKKHLVNPAAINLCAIFDSDLSFGKRVTLRVNLFIHQNFLFFFLSWPDLEKVICAFISSRFELRAEPKTTSKRQLVKNNKYRKTRSYQVCLESLHLLLLHFRMESKILLIIFNVFNGLPPSYSILLNSCCPVRTCLILNFSF